MRGRYDDVRIKGAELVAIGMGWPAAAAAFRDEQKIEFPLLVDRTKETYRALDIARGSYMDVIGPKVWARSAKSIMSGKGISLKPQQDPLQLGGVVVADKGGDVLYAYRSKTSSDNPPTDAVIAALP